MNNISQSCWQADAFEEESREYSLGQKVIYWTGSKAVNTSENSYHFSRKDEGYVTPVEIAGEDKVYVSRIRNDYA